MGYKRVKKSHQRKKLISIAKVGAPMLSLLLSGCPDPELVVIDEEAGAERAGEPVVFSNPKGSLYDEGVADFSVQPDLGVSEIDYEVAGEFISSNPKGSLYDEGIAGSLSDAGTAEEEDYGSTEEEDYGSTEELDLGVIEVDMSADGK